MEEVIKLNDLKQLDNERLVDEIKSLINKEKLKIYKVEL